MKSKDIIIEHITSILSIIDQNNEWTEERKKAEAEDIANMCEDSFLDRLGSLKQYSYGLCEDIVTLRNVQREFK